MNFKLYCIIVFGLLEKKKKLLIDDRNKLQFALWVVAVVRKHDRQFPLAFLSFAILSCQKTHMSVCIKWGFG